MNVPIPILVVVPIAIASFSTFCILRPGRIAESARRRYLGSSKLIQEMAVFEYGYEAWYRFTYALWGWRVDIRISLVLFSVC